MGTVKQQGAFRVQKREIFQHGFRPTFGSLEEVANVGRLQVRDTEHKIYNMNKVVVVPKET